MNEENVLIAAVKAIRADGRNATLEAIAFHLELTENDIEAPLAVLTSEMRLFRMAALFDWLGDPAPSPHIVHYVVPLVAR